jgi:ribosomal protein S19E (S16A)
MPIENQSYLTSPRRSVNAKGQNLSRLRSAFSAPTNDFVRVATMMRRIYIKNPISGSSFAKKTEFIKEKEVIVSSGEKSQKNHEKGVINYVATRFDE